MFERLWNLVREQDTLVKEARNRAVAMLKTTNEMFQRVIQGMHEGPGGGHRRRVADIDKKINHEQREVRRMVFEHLAISSTRDLLEGLRLITVVIDIERLGDLSKNIEELFEMMPKGLDFGEGEGVFKEIEQLALDVFNNTATAFENGDEEAARTAISGYNEVARRCEEHLRDVLTETSEDECVTRSDLGFMLLLRYIKRTCGHLKNISSAVVNPFDRIGFKDGLG